MSDETKNDLPVEESETTNSVLDAASDLLLDQTIPAPVRQGVEAFAKRLFTAVLTENSALIQLMLFYKKGTPA